MTKFKAFASSVAAALLLAVPFPANAKDLVRVFTEVSQQSNAPVLAATQKYVPFNGNKPITLLTLINCLDQTEATFNVKTEKLEVREFNLYKGTIKHSGPSWQSAHCSDRSR